MKNVWENLYSHYNDSHYYLSSSSSRFSFLQNWWNNKTWWWTKKPIVKLHWCVTSDTSYDKIKKTLSYNTKNFGVFIFCLKLLQNLIWKSLNIQDLFAEARKYFLKNGPLRTELISQGIWDGNCHKTWSYKFYGCLWLSAVQAIRKGAYHKQSTFATIQHYCRRDEYLATQATTTAFHYLSHQKQEPLTFFFSLTRGH